MFQLYITGVMQALLWIDLIYENLTTNKRNKTDIKCTYVMTNIHAAAIMAK